VLLPVPSAMQEYHKEGFCHKEAFCLKETLEKACKSEYLLGNEKPERLSSLMVFIEALDVLEDAQNTQEKEGLVILMIFMWKFIIICGYKGNMRSFDQTVAWLSHKDHSGFENKMHWNSIVFSNIGPENAFYNIVQYIARKKGVIA
jgi:hypothetical protein